jgi:metal-dependent amidase/aminoacylase/carboxypeptidase family protein
LDLYQHPELSHAEHRTARRVAGQLRDAGFTIASGIGGTGVAGVLANGGGPAVLLRCELDALPLREATGAPYASTATATEIPRQTVSEDFSKIPDAVGAPYCYWGFGFTDPDSYLAAEKDGHLEDLPTNHSPRFLPPLRPTLRTGTEAPITAALACLAP